MGSTIPGAILKATLDLTLKASTPDSFGSSSVSRMMAVDAETKDAILKWALLVTCSMKSVSASMLQCHLDMIWISMLWIHLKNQHFYQLR